jgi:glycosyltransferase involved in cell wall biosynthesis
MNILFINSIQMFGGGEVWMLNTLTALQERGHNTLLLCRPQTELGAKAKSRGLKVKILKIGGDFDPITILKIFKIIKENRIQIVLTNMDKELRLAGLAARLAGVKAVIPRRGIDYPLKNSWRYRFTYNVLAARIIANSEATKKSLLKNSPWLKPPRIKIIYNGIDISQFSFQPPNGLLEEFNIPEHVAIIGFVGQLDERKGIADLLNAYKVVNKQLPQTRLLLVGDGKLRSFVEKQKEELPRPSSIILTGFREDIPRIMNLMDVLVLPSYWEGFGLVLVEAMAAGKPVVTTKVSSMPEIVKDGVHGYLVEPGDSTALAKALIKVLTNAQLAVQMGAQGRQQVEQHFTLNGMIDKIEEVFFEAALYNKS